MAYHFDKAYELIESAHRRGRLAHAFLISGDSHGDMERLAAKVIQLVNKEETGGMNLFGEPEEVEEVPLDELESGWVRVLRPKMKSRKIGVDEIRNLEHTLHLAAPGGKTKVGVIVDADRMNDQSANAFLKTLEEPPEHTLLLLLTTNPQRLLTTILSRCVRVPLLGGGMVLDEEARKMIAELGRAAKRAFGHEVGAMQLKGLFSEALEAEKATAQATAKAAEKEEVAAYKNATDGTWLKDREVFHKAAAEADYLDARNRLLDVLLAWMADLLRVKAGAPCLAFAEQAGVFQEIAERQSETSLLRRVRALDDLRSVLDTNAFEPLAIEVAFLKAFG